jgi:hypothetical protein
MFGSYTSLWAMRTVVLLYLRIKGRVKLVQTPRSSALLLSTTCDISPSASFTPKQQSIMKLNSAALAIAALLPSALACKGHTGGLPKAVGTKTNSKVIEVAAGKVFDGQWYKYDRGNGACSSQTEGGERSLSSLPFGHHD